MDSNFATVVLNIQSLVFRFFLMFKLRTLSNVQPLVFRFFECLN